MEKLCVKNRKIHHEIAMMEQLWGYTWADQARTGPDSKQGDIFMDSSSLVVLE